MTSERIAWALLREPPPLTPMNIGPDARHFIFGGDLSLILLAEIFFIRGSFTWSVRRSKPLPHP